MRFATAHSTSTDQSIRKNVLKEIYKAAAPSTAKCFRFAIKNGGVVEDRDAMLEAISLASFSIMFASNMLRSDRELVMRAVQQWGYALQYASDELKNDKELVREALKHSPLAFCHASPTLRADWEIALPAIRHNPKNLKYCSYDIRGNKDAVMEAIRCENMHNGPSLYYAFAHLWADTELLSATERKEKEKEDQRESSGFYRR